MPRWYYSTNGKAEGPVEPQFLIEGLKTGQFTLVDLVFCEGESAWKTFGEVPEYREAFNAIPVFVPPPVLNQIVIEQPEVEVIDESFAPSAGPIFVPQSHTVSAFRKPEKGWPTDWQLSTSWIVLRKRADGSGYDQDGPFSAEYIIECIGSGKIDYSQYCWKPGYTRWFRIGNLPEFDRRKRDRENDQVNQIVPVPAITESLPALSREQLLANVDRLKRGQQDDKDQAPPEAVGPNLVEPLAVTKVVASVVSPAAASIPPAAPVPTAPAPAPERAVATKKDPPKFLRFGVAFAVALVAVIALMQFVSVRHRDPASIGERSVPKKKAEPRPAKPKSVEHAVPAAAPATSVAAVSPAARAASVLEIMPLKLETTSPSLAFQTDAGPDEKIKVQLKAHTGEILKYGSYSKTFEVSRAGGELPTLDLAAQGLPQGSYTVEASVGAVQTSQSIFVGQKNPAFLSALESHIKSLSYRQQSERAALFYGSTRIEALVKELTQSSQALKGQPVKWKKAYTDWKHSAREATLPVLALSHAPTAETTYPEQLAAFQLAIEKLARQAKMIDEAMGQQRDVASMGLDDLTGDFARIREASAKLSGRPQASN